MKSLKLLAVLLAYPTRDLVDALPEIARRLTEDETLRPGTQDALAGLLAELRREDLIDLQERYVARFDAGRSTSLHLFEHVHGDSRDRGQAMVDLNAMYRRAGYMLSGGELPDYLPALLEFLSMRPAKEVREILADCAHIVRAVGERLAERGSPYAAVFAALLDVQGEAPLDLHRPVAPRESEPALDDDWQEAPVEFGPAAAPYVAQQSRPQFIRFVPKH
jgi:nitrate reductase delta subunit